MTRRRSAPPDRAPPRPAGPSWVETAPGGVVLRVRAQPGASQSGVAGVHGEALKVKLRARPVEGEANRELVGVLAAALAVRPAAIALVSGDRGRAKRVRVDGIDVATATARLGSFVDKAGGAD